MYNYITYFLNTRVYIIGSKTLTWKGISFTSSACFVIVSRECKSDWNLFWSWTSGIPSIPTTWIRGSTIWWWGYVVGIITKLKFIRSFPCRILSWSSNISWIFSFWCPTKCQRRRNQFKKLLIWFLGFRYFLYYRLR